MSGWPDPYPAILDELWKRFHGGDEAAPALPDPPANATQHAATDPFWARAFAAFVARHFRLDASTTPDIATPARPAEPPAVPAGVPTAPETPAPPLPASLPVTAATPVTGAADVAFEPPPAPAPAAPDPATATAPDESALSADPAAALTAMLAALEAVPRDARREAWTELSAELEPLRESPDKLAGNDKAIRQALNYLEWLARRALVLPALKPAATALRAALNITPGVTADGEAEAEKVPAALPAGTRLSLLRPGYTKDGRVVLRPKALVCSQELPPARADLETFRWLADAVEELAPQADAAAWHFLRKAPELIDTMAGADVSQPKAQKLLRDCVGFATQFAWYHALPEFQSLCSGFDQVVDLIAGMLRESGIKVFPSAVQPFIDGKPAPAPFPPTVLKEVPDPAERGTLLRIRARGALRDGKIDDEPVVLVSKGGEKFPALAKALRRLAQDVRRLELPWKKRTAFVDRAEKLLQDFVEAGDDKAEALALRFLINHLDESAPDGPLRDAADALADHLKERHGVRAQVVKAGSKADSSLNPKDWDFQRQPGSGRAPDTILHVRKRSFRDASGQVVQRGVLVTA